MANETTTTSANDIFFAAWVDDMILDEERPLNVCEPVFYTVGPRQSSAVDFPLQDDPGVAGATYTEGTGLSNTSLATSKVTATAISTGQMATITDELVENSIIDAYPHFGSVLARSTLERFETDATALLDDFATTSNTAGVPLTYSTHLGAVSGLAQRDQPVGYNVRAIYDPTQVLDLARDVGTSGAAQWGAMSPPDLQEVGRAGFVARLGGADIYQTSLVTSTGGAVLLDEIALALYKVRPLRTELQRDASMPGTEVVVTTRYGMVERRDRAGQTVLI